MTEAYVRVVTKQELLSERVEILERFPDLKDYQPDADCCDGCADTEIRDRFGTDAANAWGALGDIAFLLGEDR